jgi:3'-phosphoadenosine 5'-phosphosulfate sulfotransferase (PAPS reductase)/FAD synthetase
MPVIEQMALIEPPTPEAIMLAAALEHGPFAARFCLCSGGADSTVLAHRLRDWYDALVFIDTGTALPGVRDHVHRVAELVDRPLLIYEAGAQWRTVTLAYGFLGPGQHRIAYNRLKLRQVERLVRDHKTRRSDRVALLTGVRRDESQRRQANAPNLGMRIGAQVWINPLVHHTSEQMRAYRTEHDLPLSDVAALIHRSGECNCGCFAAPGEREMLASLWPAWFEQTIAGLERQAADAGLAACRWGARPPDGTPAPGLLCSDCQLQLNAR